MIHIASGTILSRIFSDINERNPSQTDFYQIGNLQPHKTTMVGARFSNDKFRVMSLSISLSSSATLLL